MTLLNHATHILWECEMVCKVGDTRNMSIKQISGWLVYDGASADFGPDSLESDIMMPLNSEVIWDSIITSK